MAFDASIPTADPKQNSTPVVPPQNGTYPPVAAAQSQSPDTTSTAVGFGDDPTIEQSTTSQASVSNSTSESPQQNSSTNLAENPVSFLSPYVNQAVQASVGLIRYAKSRLPTNVQEGINVTTANAVRVEQAIQTYVTSEIGSAIDYIQKIKFSGYEGECANHVRRALEAAAGISFSAAFGKANPELARQYISYFAQHGVPKIDKTNWHPEDAQPGQVVVFDKCPGHPNGHMEICTGRDQNGQPIWFSDCKQPGGFLANQNMRGQPYEVFDSQAIIRCMHQGSEQQPASLLKTSTNRIPHRHREHHFKV